MFLQCRDFLKEKNPKTIGRWFQLPLPPPKKNTKNQQRFLSKKPNFMILAFHVFFFFGGVCVWWLKIEVFKPCDFSGIYPGNPPRNIVITRWKRCFYVGSESMENCEWPGMARGWNLSNGNRKFNSEKNYPLKNVRIVALPKRMRKVA